MQDDHQREKKELLNQRLLKVEFDTKDEVLFDIFSAVHISDDVPGKLV